MKTKLIISVIIILLLSACGGSATPQAPTVTPAPAWPEFTSEIGHFSVQLPSTPAEQVQTVSSDAGDIDMYIYMVEKGDAAYGVMFNQMPEEIASLSDEASLKLMLDGGRDGALENIGGVLTSEDEISIDSYPGRHIVFAIPEEAISGGGEGVLRIFIVDGKMYQLIAIGGKGALPAGEVANFMDSFTLNP